MGQYMIGIMLILCVCCTLQDRKIRRMRSRCFFRKMDHDFERYTAQKEKSTDEQTDIIGRTSGDRKDHKRI